MLHVMSADSVSSFDAFYGIEKKKEELSFQKCDISPYSPEDKDSSELFPQTSKGSPKTSSVELLYVRRSRIEPSRDSVRFDKNSAQSSTSEKESSYYEVLDFINSDKSENFTVKDESHNEEDSDENVESDCETIPVKSVRKRILSEPAKKKTDTTIRRKVRTMQPKSKLNKTKQETKSRYVVAEQNADYVTRKLLAARKEKINELRNEIVDIQRQHKNLEDENKILRRINARQQRELSKIEESRDELPELVKAHNEEIRVMKGLLKQAREKYRELEQRMKIKDSELHKRREELQKVRLLTKNSDLLERSVLHEKVESLEKQVRERESTIMELNKKLELLQKNYKRDLTAERSRQKDFVNDMKHLQQEYEKLQLSLSLKEKKIGQQNIYCNARKPGANLQIAHPSIYSEPKVISAEAGATPKEVVSESFVDSTKETCALKDFSREKNHDGKLPHWNEKQPSNISKQLFSTPFRESIGLHSAYEKMASLLDQTSTPNERTTVLPNVHNESERPRFEKTLDQTTKERLLLHLKTMDISKDSPVSKEELAQSNFPIKRLSSPEYLSESIDDIFFSPYVPSVGESSRRSIISNIHNFSHPLETRNAGSRGFNISSPGRSQAAMENDSLSMKVSNNPFSTSPELNTDFGSFRKKTIRGAIPSSAPQYKLPNEFLSSSSDGARSSERINFSSPDARHTQNSQR